MLPPCRAKATGTRSSTCTRDAIGQQPHDGGVLDPRHGLKLRAALLHGHAEDVAVDVFAKDAEHLRAGQVAVAVDLNVRRRRDAELFAARQVLRRPQRACRDGAQAHQGYDSRHDTAIARGAASGRGECAHGRCRAGYLRFPHRLRSGRAARAAAAAGRSQGGRPMTTDAGPAHRAARRPCVRAGPLPPREGAPLILFRWLPSACLSRGRRESPCAILQRIFCWRGATYLQWHCGGSFDGAEEAGVLRTFCWPALQEKAAGFSPLPRRPTERASAPDVPVQMTPGLKPSLLPRAGQGPEGPCFLRGWRRPRALVLISVPLRP